MWQRFASNAVANLVIGGTTLGFQLGATAIVARAFDSHTFSVWTIGSSLAALTPLFGMGLSLVVARQVALAQSKGNGHREDLALSAARRLGIELSALSIVVLSGLGLVISTIAPQLQSFSSLQFAWLVAVLAAAQAWQVALQPTQGWHIAYGRNWRVAFGHLIGRFGAIGALALCALFAPFPQPMSVAMVIGAWVLLASTTKALRLAPRRRGLPRDLLEAQRQQMLPLLKGLGLWAFGSAMIQYGLPPFVAILEEQRYNAFYLAYVVNAAVAGVVAAAGSALLAPVAQQYAKGSADTLRSLLVTASCGGAALSAAMLLALWITLPSWLGVLAPRLSTPASVAVFFQLLGMQTIVRSVAISFAVMASVGGSARQLGLAVLAEVCLAAIAASIGLGLGAVPFLIGLIVAGTLAAHWVVQSALRSIGVPSMQRTRIALVVLCTQAGAGVLWLTVTIRVHH